MKHLPGEPSDVAGVSFAADQLTMNIHGDVDSHIDALCHVSYEGRLYNDIPASAVTSQGASELSIDDVHDGIVGRGVLLDIPRLRNVPWLEPGDHVTAGELAAAEAAQGLQVGPGDLLFVRVGHRRRRGELGPWEVARERAGLHPLAAEYLAERQVAALGCDGNSDTAPSLVEGLAFPMHVLAINAMGVFLLDYLQFEDFTPLCAAASRWSFLCVVGPLRLAGGPAPGQPDRDPVRRRRAGRGGGSVTAGPAAVWIHDTRFRAEEDEMTHPPATGYAPVSGVQVYWESRGQGGTPLVVVHGGFGLASMFGGFARPAGRASPGRRYRAAGPRSHPGHRPPVQLREIRRRHRRRDRSPRPGAG